MGLVPWRVVAQTTLLIYEERMGEDEKAMKRLEDHLADRLADVTTGQKVGRKKMWKAQPYVPGKRGELVSG